MVPRRARLGSLSGAWRRRGDAGLVAGFVRTQHSKSGDISSRPSMGTVRLRHATAKEG